MGQKTNNFSSMFGGNWDIDDALYDAETLQQKKIQGINRAAHARAAKFEKATKQATNFIKNNPKTVVKVLTKDAIDATKNAIKKHPGVAAGVVAVPVVAGTAYALSNKNKADEAQSKIDQLQKMPGSLYADYKAKYESDPTFRRNVNIGAGVAATAALAGAGTLAYKLYQKAKAKKSKYSR